MYIFLLKLVLNTWYERTWIIQRVVVNMTINRDVEVVRRYREEGKNSILRIEKSILDIESMNFKILN